MKILLIVAIFPMLHNIIAGGRTQPISFLAVHTTRQTVPPGGIVKFSTVRHNYAPPGYGYEPAISRFRCPAFGVYAFFFGIRGFQCGADFHFVIMKDNDMLSGAYGHAASNCQLSMSASATTSCNRGQYVYVRNIDTRPGKGGRKIFSDAAGYVHFTGFKI